jgi:hypothetical protein
MIFFERDVHSVGQFKCLRCPRPGFIEMNALLIKLLLQGIAAEGFHEEEPHSQDVRPKHKQTLAKLFV